jgi:hypothetical protein
MKITYHYHSNSVGAKYRCTAISNDVLGTVIQYVTSIQASSIQEASELFNEFLSNHFEDANEPWQVTIEEA